MPGQENRDDRVVFDAVQLFIGDEADHRLGELPNKFAIPFR
jgi:hypothetical protein